MIKAFACMPNSGCQLKCWHNCTWQFLLGMFILANCVIGAALFFSFEHLVTFGEHSSYGCDAKSSFTLHILGGTISIGTFNGHHFILS
jgi:hypothetical protein